jgi:ATP-dependent RNA helicase RhlE
LRDPIQVEVAARNAVTDTVTHTVFKVDSRAKRDALVNLLRERDMKQVLVFCNTKIGANRLAYRLQKDDLGAAAIHSDRTQGERMQALAEFKEGKVRILVATDIAARGLDIEQLPFVVNFDMPSNPEDYVHRIGRTGRAGLLGEAISLIGTEDVEYLAAVEKLIKKKLQIGSLPGPVRNSARRQTPSRASSGSAGKKQNADPLFDQPYVSSQPSGVKPVASKSPALASNGNRKKEAQIPALFLPPVVKPDA